ncbi:MULTISPECIES: hypothetical protein [Streptomyces]|uniref:Uncharacterized protein n=1 Tax=Streptomyces chartreusis NRRL 3882 TaxID=1079985 RepID=A0A2N9B0G7_STRCX|nr:MULTISPECIES: hypothetical protein [Streptomyces]MYS90964.1 hypothetical protein [Streptomyces sp. SID5464]SOR76829.1 hypothetical protein SCNRRL3882_0308 [Streptomyces chartreusis NRRL 3882]
MTEQRTDPPGARRAPATDMSLLGVYLNDHLAGATAGTARIRHLLRSCRGTALADTLAPVAAEIAEDRASLLHIMRRLDVPVRRYKVYAGRAVEQMARLKSNGSLVRRSPLSTLWELEALSLGVEGKSSGWQTLRDLAATDTRLDARHLDDLVERARRQRATLEELRRDQVRVAFRET